MTDGTVLKANVYSARGPGGTSDRGEDATIVHMTPYTKLVSMVADSAQSVPGLSDALIGFARDFDLSGTGFSGITELTKALAGGFPRNFAVDRKLIQSGYSQVVVDVRGTGFSHGVWEVFQRREQIDTVEVIDWAAAQPWSTAHRHERCVVLRDQPTPSRRATPRTPEGDLPGRARQRPACATSSPPVVVSDSAS